MEKFIPKVSEAHLLESPSVGRAASEFQLAVTRSLEQADPKKKRKIAAAIGRTIEGVTLFTLKQLRSIITQLSLTGGEAMRNFLKPASEGVGDTIRNIGQPSIDISAEAMEKLVPAAARTAGAMPFEVARGAHESIKKFRKS